MIKLYKGGFLNKNFFLIKIIYYLLIMINKVNLIGSNKIYYFLYLGKKEEGYRFLIIWNCLFVVGINIC